MKRVSRISRLGRVMAGIALAGAAATGAQALDMPSITPERHVPVDSWEPAFTHQFETDIDGGAKFELNSVGTRFNYEVDLGPGLKWGILGFYARDMYDFTVSGAGPTNLPWENINTFGVGSIFRWEANEQTGVFAGPLFRWSGEDGVDWGEALSAGGVAGFLYQHRPDLALGFGLAVMTALEDGTQVVPIPLIRWQAAPEWHVRSGLRDLGTRTLLGGEVTWQRGELPWNVNFGFGFTERRFRLDRDGVVRDGIGEESSIPLYVEGNWIAGNSLTLQAFGGFSMSGEIRLESSSGARIVSADYDTPGFVGVGLQYSF